MQTITDDNIKNLIVRLDRCSSLVEAAEKGISSDLLGRIKAQRLAYAGFAADLASGKLPRFSEPTIHKANLAEEFCSLIETELGQA